MAGKRGETGAASTTCVEVEVRFFMHAGSRYFGSTCECLENLFGSREISSNRSNSCAFTLETG